MIRMFLLLMLIAFNTTAQKDCIAWCSKYRVWSIDEGKNLTEQGIIDYMNLKDSLYCACLSNCSFPNATFTDINEGTITPQSLSNKILIINFWFTGCQGCLHEFRALNRVFLELTAKSDKYTFLSITFDTKNQIKNKKWEKYINFSNIIPDAKQIIDDFGIRVFPASMIIDTKGCIYPLHIGVVEADANIGKEEEMYYSKIKKILSDISQ